MFKIDESRGDHVQLKLCKVLGWVTKKKKKNSLRDELVMSGWVEGEAETVLFRAKHFRPFDFWALINLQAKNINLKLCFGQNKKRDWRGRDQEGAVPGGQQLTKRITEYTQWDADETREIKGCRRRGPSEAFRGDPPQPGSPHAHSCFRAPMLPHNKAASVWRNHKSKASSRKPLIGVENWWPCEL